LNRCAGRKILPGFSAVILDLDGLVIDSEPTYQAAWRQAGRCLGFPLREDLVQSFLGKSYDRIEQALKTEFGPDFPLETFRQTSAGFWRESVERTGIPVKPGVHALLADLERHAIPFCLATNSEQIYAEKCLDYAGLGNAFPIRVTRDQVASPKPAPDIFLAAAARLEVVPERCIVLEDSETGARAALDANTVVLLVAGSTAVPPDLRAQLFAVLENLHEFRWLLENR
jgi:HAD superfamily hydrolase (TIGR01509 family)